MREREQAKQAAEQCEEEDPEPVAMKRPVLEALPAHSHPGGAAVFQVEGTGGCRGTIRRPATCVICIDIEDKMLSFHVARYHSSMSFCWAYHQCGLAEEESGPPCLEPEVWFRVGRLRLL
mmetsp:Transcript_32655/g.76240  ORF Transcript_32655/g.76240 Transcript_32655/m.76240 type:complete len:120 (-) Transcript_32655:47-406(-)